MVGGGVLPAGLAGTVAGAVVVVGTVVGAGAVVGAVAGAAAGAGATGAGDFVLEVAGGLGVSGPAMVECALGVCVTTVVGTVVVGTVVDEGTVIDEGTVVGAPVTGRRACDPCSHPGPGEGPRSVAFVPD